MFEEIMIILNLTYLVNSQFETNNKLSRSLGHWNKCNWNTWTNPNHIRDRLSNQTQINVNKKITRTSQVRFPYIFTTVFFFYKFKGKKSLCFETCQTLIIFPYVFPTMDLLVQPCDDYKGPEAEEKVQGPQVGGATPRSQRFGIR